MLIRVLLVAAVLASSVARAAEGDAVAVTAAPEPAAIPQSPVADQAWRRGWQGTVGVGYYERLHVGVAYAPSARSAVGLFGGSDFGLGTDTTWDLGLSYAHAVGRPMEQVQIGWDAKAIYWQQSNPDYDWKMMSLLGGAYLAREVHPGLTIAVDAGVALNFSLATTRKQNVNYEYPTRWNGSVCLELRYGFDRW